MQKGVVLFKGYKIGKFILYVAFIFNSDQLNPRLPKGGVLPERFLAIAPEPFAIES